MAHRVGFSTDEWGAVIAGFRSYHSVLQSISTTVVLAMKHEQ